MKWHLALLWAGVEGLQTTHSHKAHAHHHKKHMVASEAAQEPAAPTGDSAVLATVDAVAKKTLNTVTHSMDVMNSLLLANVQQMQGINGLKEAYNDIRSVSNDAKEQVAKCHNSLQECMATVNAGVAVGSSGGADILLQVSEKTEKRKFNSAANKMFAQIEELEKNLKHSKKIMEHHVAKTQEMLNLMQVENQQSAKSHHKHKHHKKKPSGPTTRVMSPEEMQELARGSSGDLEELP